MSGANSITDPIYGYWHYGGLAPHEFARADLFCRTQSLASISGIFMHAPPYESEATAEGLFVADYLRQQGIGAKLLRALACLAIEEGITTLGGSLTSPHTLKMYAKLASGEDRITFYDITPQGEYVELPFNSQQAYSSLEHASRLEEDLEKRKHGIDTAIELSLDTRSALVAPIMLNTARHIKVAYR